MPDPRSAIAAARGVEAAALNALPYALVIINDSDTIIYANTAAEILFHAGRETLCREGLSTFLPPGCPLPGLINEAKTRKLSVHEYNIDIATARNGHATPVDVQIRVLTEPEPAPEPAPALAGELMIIFQTRSLAHKLNQQTARRKTGHSIGVLGAMLAHEVKNPLSGIRGAAQLLQPGLQQKDQKLTRLICEETDRICRLVDRMEVFGDSAELNIKPLNIHEVIGHSCHVAISGFAANIRFIEEYDPSLPPVAGDNDQLVQVFLNLIKNAAEALGENREPEITIRTAYKSDIRVTRPDSDKPSGLPIEISIIGQWPRHCSGHPGPPVRALRQHQTRKLRRLWSWSGSGRQNHR